MRGCRMGKALLLMRETPAQIFCANTLFREGLIDCVYIEDGSTGEPDAWTMIHRLRRYGPVGIWERLVRDLRVFDGRRGRLMAYYLTRLRTQWLVGRQPWHEDRLLGPICRRFDPGLRVVRGPSVNDLRCRQLIHEGAYQLIFVFGTGLLRDGLLEEPRVTFVNLHHGWLPRFRGEGVLSALGEEGVEGLGVTVHLVDHGVDTGPILYRERLIVERYDNAYAIALKATIRGTALFRQVYADARRGPLRGIPQDGATGRLYRSQDLKRAFQMRLAAARNLRALAAQRIPSSKLKRLAAWGGTLSGLAVLSRRRHGRRLRVLLYHGVLQRVDGPAAFGNLFLDVERFARHLRYLVRSFTIVSLNDVLACLATGRPFPERAVMVTFDDGYRQTLEMILPLLQEFRVPVMAFVPADDVSTGSCSWFDILRVLLHDCVREATSVRLGEAFVIDGRTVRHPEETFMALSRRFAAMSPRRLQHVVPELLAAGARARVLERYPEFALAGWAQWRQAVASGLMTVGSHGLTHHNLVSLSPSERLRELVLSKQRIEQELTQPCQAIAYPYGAWNRDVAEAARQVGYVCGLTTDPGLNAAGDDPFALRRTMVGDRGDVALFRIRASGLLERGNGIDTPRH